MVKGKWFSWFPTFSKKIKRWKNFLKIESPKIGESGESGESQSIPCIREFLSGNLVTKKDEIWIIINFSRGPTCILWQPAKQIPISVTQTIVTRVNMILLWFSNIWSVCKNDSPWFPMILLVENHKNLDGERPFFLYLI